MLRSFNCLGKAPILCVCGSQCPKNHWNLAAREVQRSFRQLNCSRAISDCVFGGGCEHPCKIAGSIAVLRLYCQRILPLLDRFPYVALLNECCSQNIARFYVLGFYLQEFAIMNHCLG